MGRVPPRVVESPRVYADGSALTRFLPGAPQGQMWRVWAERFEPMLLTTPLGTTELRGTARALGGQAVQDVAHDVARRLEVIRFSDQAIARATDVGGVATAYVALHCGAMLTHRDVTGVATYDAHLARLGALFGLVVVSPGLPTQWWERDATPW
ncbi:hypothetical protein [Cellulomonas sp.]|uniref:hypothetical protein n=1 Tax=Cellulomonas sp. TaxID=40001 RepID=UPI00258590A7|nr:hypothetical protein [Cellulomonas sp.]MCR6688384.1 hypothetical protein [Cellulomonas sp.]